MMNILVVDGQGGGIGRQLIEEMRAELPEANLTAVGTNAFATSAMLKAGANQAATGENAAIVACRTADVIVGPVGIVIADSLMGELTPAMATAIAQSRALRVLIPVNQCDTFVVGVPELSTARLIAQAVETIRGWGGKNA